MDLENVLDELFSMCSHISQPSTPRPPVHPAQLPAHPCTSHSCSNTSITHPSPIQYVFQSWDPSAPDPFIFHMHVLLCSCHGLLPQNQHMWVSVHVPVHVCVQGLYSLVAPGSSCPSLISHLQCWVQFEAPQCKECAEMLD